MTDRAGRGTEKKTANFASRIQKKLISQFATKGITKYFLSDELSNIVDHMYQLLKVHSKDREYAEKMMSNIIKIGLKIKILVQSDQCNRDDLQKIDRFGLTLEKILKNIVWFSEKPRLYDRQFLIEGISLVENVIKLLVQNNWSKNSLSCLTTISQVLQDSEFLDKSFEPGSSHNKYMKRIGVEIKNALISGGRMSSDETFKSSKKESTSRLRPASKASA